MVLRRYVWWLVVLALVVTLAPLPAAASSRKRRERREQESRETPSPADTRKQSMKDKRDRAPTPETEEERARRWERWLRSKDRDEVLAAIAEMHGAETPEACRQLSAFVRSTADEGLREAGLLALGWRGNRAALELLFGKHGAASSRLRVVAAACRAIGAIGDAASRPFLVERLRSEEEETAAAALGGIVALDPRAPGLPALLTRSAEHTSALVRAEAATALGHVPVDDWRDRLTTLCADASPSVRAAACRALGERKDEASAPLLLQLQADDFDEAVRAAALAALMAIEESLSAE